MRIAKPHVGRTPGSARVPPDPAFAASGRRGRRLRTRGSAPRASFPFAGLLQLLDFALDQIAFQRAQMIDEEDSVQVIDLVQESTGEQVLATDFESLAFDISGAHDGFFGAAHRLAKAGYAEASLFAGLLAFLRDHFGI